MASEYLKWKYRDVKREKQAELTPAEKRKNWWHYHKWHTAAAVAVALIAVNLIWHILTQTHPDYQLAYVGSLPLSEEETAAWEGRLSALGTDSNGDSKVIIQINQYIMTQNSENAMYDYASSVKLMADLDSCESYFFLLEEPELFQTDYEVLQEDWFPLENGLYLARRGFWTEKTAPYPEGCEALWNELTKGAAG